MPISTSMANLGNLPGEVLLLILEAKEGSSFRNWDGAILSKGDFVRLSRVNKALYNALKKLIWHDLEIELEKPRDVQGEIESSKANWTVERVVQLYNALVHNPANACLVEKVSIYWHTEPVNWTQLVDIDCRKTGRFGRKQISCYALTNKLLRQLHWLKHLSISSSTGIHAQTQYKWTLDLEKYPFLTSLSLAGFIAKSQDIHAIVANKKLRSLSLSVRIVEAEWCPPPSELFSNVTRLSLSQQGQKDYHQVSVYPLANSVTKDILSLFPNLTDLYLTISAHSLEGTNNMGLILDELGQRCKIRSLSLQAWKDPGECKIDLRNWHHLETLQAKMHCLFPVSTDFHERVDLCSRLPGSLRILRIEFPEKIEHERHEITLHGILWKREIMMQNKKPPPFTEDNYKWIDRLADACLDHKLPDLKEVQLIEVLEGEKILWRQTGTLGFAPRWDIQEKFDRAKVNIQIRVRNKWE